MFGARQLDILASLSRSGIHANKDTNLKELGGGVSEDGTQDCPLAWTCTHTFTCMHVIKDLNGVLRVCGG